MYNKKVDNKIVALLHQSIYSEILEANSLEFKNFNKIINSDISSQKKAEYFHKKELDLNRALLVKLTTFNDTNPVDFVDREFENIEILNDEINEYSLKFAKSIPFNFFENIFSKLVDQLVITNSPPYANNIIKGIIESNTLDECDNDYYLTGIKCFKDFIMNATAIKFCAAALVHLSVFPSDVLFNKYKLSNEKVKIGKFNKSSRNKKKHVKIEDISRETKKRLIELSISNKKSYSTTKHNKNEKHKSKYHSFTYKNNLDAHTNLTDLMKSLKQKQLIADDTELAVFRKAFSGEEVEKRIVWTGNISELSYFIKQLHNVLRYVEGLKQQQWAVTVNCFIQEDGKLYDRTKLRTQKIPTTSKNIDSALKTLK